MNSNCLWANSAKNANLFTLSLTEKEHVSVQSIAIIVFRKCFPSWHFDKDGGVKEALAVATTTND